MLDLSAVRAAHNLLHGVLLDFHGTRIRSGLLLLGLVQMRISIQVFGSSCLNMFVVLSTIIQHQEMMPASFHLIEHPAVSSEPAEDLF